MDQEEWPPLPSSLPERQTGGRGRGQRADSGSLFTFKGGLSYGVWLRCLDSWVPLIPLAPENWPPHAGQGQCSPRQPPVNPAQSLLPYRDKTLGRPRQALCAPGPFLPHLSLPLGQGDPVRAQGRSRPQVRVRPPGGSQTLCPSVPCEHPCRTRGRRGLPRAAASGHSWEKLGV